MEWVKGYLFGLLTIPAIIAVLSAFNAVTVRFYGHGMTGIGRLLCIW